MFQCLREKAPAAVEKRVTSRQGLTSCCMLIKEQLTFPRWRIRKREQRRRKTHLRTSKNIGGFGAQQDKNELCGAHRRKKNTANEDIRVKLAFVLAKDFRGDNLHPSLVLNAAVMMSC